jgi:SAM-dependent methyltransferase
MARRRELVAGRAWTRRALLRRVRPRAGRLQRVMASREGGVFRSVPLDGDEAELVIAAGERVFIYDLDLASDDDLVATNALFSREYYLSSSGDVWPDERAIIAAELPRSRAAVIEICCGAGRVTRALVRRGNRVTGVDTSAECIGYAAAVDQGCIDYCVADATALPFPDRVFDVGCCFENSLGVLFGRRALALAELIRVSRSRVVLGLRKVPGTPESRLHVYHSRDGLIEIAQTFSRELLRRLLVESGARGRVGAKRFVDGGARPWGGCELFALLDLRS